MTDYSFTDIGIMTIVLISTFIGIYRGFFRELITIVLWIIGIVFAYIHGKALGNHLTFIDSSYIQDAIGMSLIFIGVVLAGMLIKFLTFKSMGIAKPSAFDRLMGALFGAFRGFALIIIAIIAFSSGSVVDEDWYQGSKIIARLEGIADDISGNVSQKWKKWDRKKDGTGSEQSVPITTEPMPQITPAEMPATTVEPVAEEPASTPTADIVITPKN